MIAYKNASAKAKRKQRRQMLRVLKAKKKQEE